MACLLTAKEKTAFTTQDPVTLKQIMTVEPRLHKLYGFLLVYCQILSGAPRSAPLLLKVKLCNLKRRNLLQKSKLSFVHPHVFQNTYTQKIFREMCLWFGVHKMEINWGQCCLVTNML